MLHAPLAAVDNAALRNNAETEAAPVAERSPFADFQQTHGNQALLRHLRAGVPLQMKCACGGSGESCGPCEEEQRLKMQRAPLDAQVPHTGDVPEIAASHGMPMPAPLRARAEVLFGADFSAIRLHDDGAAAQAAARVAARAFTVDNDIYFGGGWYRPHTDDGARLVGHELAHVVQQHNGLASADLKGTGDRYEQEADAAGSAFVKGEAVSIAGGGGTIHAQPQRSPDTAAADAEEVGFDPRRELPVVGHARNREELAAIVASFQQRTTRGRVVLLPASVLRTAAPATSPRAVQTSPLGRPLQRAIVAGCNMPGVSPGVIGTMAHTQIRTTCAGTAPGCSLTEMTIPGDGRVDLFRTRVPYFDEIARSSRRHGSQGIAEDSPRGNSLDTLPHTTPPFRTRR
jgi:hypothetical protein